MEEAPFCKPQKAGRSSRFPANHPPFVLCFVSALVLTFSAPGVYAQASIPTTEYTTIVVFGDSLSDTGNLAHLTYDKYGLRIPGPVADYTDGRLTDGFDTLPAAQKY